MTGTEEENEVLSVIRGFYRDAIPNNEESITIPESLYATVTGEPLTKVDEKVKKVKMLWKESYTVEANKYHGKLAAKLTNEQLFPPDKEHIPFHLVIKDPANVSL